MPLASHDAMQSPLAKLGAPMAVAILSMVLASWLVRRKRQKKLKALPHATRRSKAAFEAELSLQRRAAILHGGAVDHAGEVVMATREIDIKKTIFHTLKEGTLAHWAMRNQLSQAPRWSEEAMDSIMTNSASLPTKGLISNSITDFMRDDCNFLMEHADGSFMDHLTFCTEYCAAHYKEVSPNVLLLHSILGVGSNIFPMEASKTPKLASLLTPFEMKHVEAFPAVLRLLTHGPLLKELTARKGSIDKLKSIKFHKVIDNTEMELDAESLWVMLNYQVIHMMDFMPATDWAGVWSMPITQIFLDVHELLSDVNQLRAKIRICLADGAALEGQELAEHQQISKGGLWTALKRKKIRESIKGFSDAIGHSMAYSIEWAS